MGNKKDLVNKENEQIVSDADVSKKWREKKLVTAGEVSYKETKIEYLKGKLKYILIEIHSKRKY